MRKAKKISFSIFWFVFISIIAVGSSQYCIGTRVFITNDEYDVNLKSILSSLASNVTNPGGFYNSSLGEGSNQVFAMGMCINGSEPAVCSECIKIAVNQLIYNCPNQIEAFTWTPHRTLCFARYSDISFFGILNNDLRYSELNSVMIKSYDEVYASILKNETKNMINTGLGKSESFSNRDYYSISKIPVKDHQALYALMQCTPGLPPDKCRECLQKSVNDHDGKDIRSTQGGIIAYPSCFFQWDLYPFIEAFTFAPPPPPPPDCKKVPILAAIVSTAVIISVLSVAVVVSVCRRRKADPPEEKSTTSSLQYDLKTIEAATCTFSRSNILGKGGFGEVFKGVLPDRSEIAVKRLPKESA